MLGVPGLSTSQGAMMTDANTPAIPAGWYPDPAGGPRSRWWDGQQWTEHYQEPYSTAGVAAALRAPEGTRTNTPWIWLVIVLPLLSMVPLFFIDWTGYITSAATSPGSSYTGQLEMITSPAYLLSSVGSWVIYALIVLFAFLDWRALTRAGVPRPFHWAWAFLSSVVYAIGRAVVVNRRTGHGIAIMWVAIGSIVLQLIIGIVFMVWIFEAVFQAVSPYNGY
jgi:hypothetical protein